MRGFTLFDVNPLIDRRQFGLLGGCFFLVSITGAGIFVFLVCVLVLAIAFLIEHAIGSIITLDDTFDFLIRNQAYLVGATVVIGAMLTRMELRALQYSYNVPVFDSRVTRIADGWIYPFIILTVGGILGHSNTRVVSPTVALSPPPLLCSHDGARTAIVLLHGWTGDAQASWKPFSDFACADPRLQSADIYGLNYPSYIIARSLYVWDLSGWLYKSFFLPILDPRYDSIYIVAHSMGGVVARSVYINEMLNRGESKIRSIISIGSPFEGAGRLPALAAALGISRELLGDLRPDSSFIRMLYSQWADLRARPYSYCITSPQDGIVERDSATSQCNCPFPYPQWGHTELEKPGTPTDERYLVPTNVIHTLMNGPPPVACF
jgi:pimeloyl-ACP methyl ester carboxylesterase